jgi:hypothetical protein
VVEFSGIEDGLVFMILTNGSRGTFAALEQAARRSLLFIPRLGARGTCPAFDAVYVHQRQIRPQPLYVTSGK